MRNTPVCGLNLARLLSFSRLFASIFFTCLHAWDCSAGEIKPLTKPVAEEILRSAGHVDPKVGAIVEGFWLGEQTRAGANTVATVLGASQNKTIQLPFLYDSEHGWFTYSFRTNETERSLTIWTTSGKKFFNSSTKESIEEFTARPINPADAAEKCRINLEKIYGAQMQWALEEKKVRGDKVDEDKVVKLLKGQQLPKCPGLGVYKLTSVGAPPECSRWGHAMSQ